MKATIPVQHSDLPRAAEDNARQLLALVADKWTILIMSELCGGPARFNALKRRIDGISQKALAQTLRRLERNGIIERRVLPGAPPAVEYRGTDLGFSLGTPMRALLSWSVDHLAIVERAQQAYDARGGAGNEPC